MAWYWVVLLCAAMYGLGLLGASVFRKPHAPERRVGDRRSADGTVQVDRRRADRRTPQSKWPAATVIAASGVILSLIGVVSYAESQVGSFFDANQPALSGSGWAQCDTPITWSVDTSRLTAAEKATALRQMAGDFKKWGQVSGLTFRYAGEVPVTYNDSDYSVSSVTHPSSRHIFMVFLHDSDSSLLDTRTVGFGEPTKVYPNRKEIIEGAVVLSIDYVKKASRLQRATLYLHEVGHALGLGHAESKSSVMFPIVDSNNDLSPADITGIRALTKVCATQ